MLVNAAVNVYTAFRHAAVHLYLQYWREEGKSPRTWRTATHYE